jgi:hypothetical protein
MQIQAAGGGEDARIIIVATHCQTEGCIARIGEIRLRRNYGDVIVEFYEKIDSKTGYGIDTLKEISIARTVAKLPQMGNPFPSR